MKVVIITYLEKMKFFASLKQLTKIRAIRTERKSNLHILDEYLDI